MLTDVTVSGSRPGRDLAESYGGDRCRFDGLIVLDHSGALGHTVRVTRATTCSPLAAVLGVVAVA
jgi:hypothetical protein